ncbi:triacylglycerol lipase 2 [Phtheirospermum japonicum]|uniref:Triacylglycerol lipase 2 n=1 Tax=Phtheirospermum japonicum TaxID=374723 RepID=A0A830DAH3_9LAMI|nr:triacylglycerol lipase 2 [Phtheirospermum japonicum]
MITNSFLNLAFLILLSLSVIHCRFLPDEEGDDGIAPAPPEGLCSAVTIHGFKCKEYHVKTDDGYILGVQRIPEGRTGPGDGSQPRLPVLLQHGVIVDGMNWLMTSPEQALAMMLADNGYDVWISNHRGTRFSRRHVSLDPMHPEFWNWTWVDLANQDLPAVIGLVFKETGQQMHYVGHSMGTLVALVLLSEGKLENVKSAALLCPIAYLSHVTSPVALAGAKFFIGEVSNFFFSFFFNFKYLSF